MSWEGPKYLLFRQSVGVIVNRAGKNDARTSSRMSDSRSISPRIQGDMLLVIDIGVEQHEPHQHL